MQHITIYAPPGVDFDVMRQLRIKWPTARFVNVWQTGAIMWQDALKSAAV